MKTKCILALCHRKQPIDFLLKLSAKHDDYLEEVITIGKYYYLSKDISESKFIDHVNIYSSWLLSILVHILDENNPKTPCFLDLLAKTESGAELIQKYCNSLIEKELISTVNILLIIEKYSTRNHRFLKAISQN